MGDRFDGPALARSRLKALNRDDLAFFCRRTMLRLTSAFRSRSVVCCAEASTNSAWKGSAGSRGPSMSTLRGTTHIAHKRLAMGLRALNYSVVRTVPCMI